MNEKSARKIFQRELRLLCHAWRLPVCTGAHGGELRILVGLAILNPRKVLNDIPWNRFAENLYREQPVFIRDPIGAALSQRPLTGANFFKEWKEIGFTDAINDRRFLRDTFVHLGQAQLEVSLRIVYHNSTELKGLLESLQPSKGKSVRDSLQDLFREKRRLLEAEDISPPISGSSDEKIRAMRVQARSYMRQHLNRKTDPFPHGFEATRVKLRSSRTALDSLGSVRATPPLSRALGSDAPDDIEAKHDARKSVRTERPQDEWPNWVYRCHSKDYPVRQPARGMPCRIEVRQIIRAASSLKDSADIIIEMCLCGLVIPRLLPQLKSSRWDDHWSILMFPCSHIHAEPPVEAKHLYHECGTLVQRFIPSRLEKAFRGIQNELRKKTTFHQIVREAFTRAKSYVPTTTLARCLAAIRIHGPSWFSVDFTLADWGMRPHYSEDRPSVHAARSYTYLSQANMRSSYRLCLDFDETLPAPKVGFNKGWGARYCPKKEVLRRMGERMKQILHGKYAGIEVGIRHWNFVTSVSHLMILMLCGLRNYPFESTKQLGLPEDFVEIIHQKGPVITLSPPTKVRSILSQLENFWKKLTSLWIDSGVPKSFLSIGREPYSFIDVGSINRGRPWTPLPICHLSVIKGLRNDTAKNDFSEIGINAMRDFSNTELRRCGKFKEVDIRNYHHHYELAIQPLRRHRIEPLTHAKVIEKMADHLAKEIGL